MGINFILDRPTFAMENGLADISCANTRSPRWPEKTSFSKPLAAPISISRVSHKWAGLSLKEATSFLNTLGANTWILSSVGLPPWWHLLTYGAGSFFVVGAALCLPEGSLPTGCQQHHPPSSGDNQKRLPERSKCPLGANLAPSPRTTDLSEHNEIIYLTRSTSQAFHQSWPSGMYLSLRMHLVQLFPDVDPPCAICFVNILYLSISYLNILYHVILWISPNWVTLLKDIWLFPSFVIINTSLSPYAKCLERKAWRQRYILIHDAKSSFIESSTHMTSHHQSGWVPVSPTLSIQGITFCFINSCQFNKFWNGITVNVVSLLLTR